MMARFRALGSGLVDHALQKFLDVDLERSGSGKPTVLQLPRAQTFAGLIHAQEVAVNPVADPDPGQLEIHAGQADHHEPKCDNRYTRDHDSFSTETRRVRRRSIAP